jgi:hypothetical protein
MKSGHLLGGEKRNVLIYLPAIQNNNINYNINNVGFLSETESTFLQFPSFLYIHSR